MSWRMGHEVAPGDSLSHLCFLGQAVPMIRSLHAPKDAAKPLCRGDAAWGSHAAEARGINFVLSSHFAVDCIMTYE